MGKRPFRMRALPDALDSISGHAQVRDALGTSMAKGVLPHDQAADASWIRKRARDLQFVFPASGGQLEPVGASVPFGSEQGGQSLSDHFGFVIDYKFIS